MIEIKFQEILGFLGNFWNFGYQFRNNSKITGVPDFQQIELMKICVSIKGKLPSDSSFKKVQFTKRTTLSGKPLLYIQK